MPSALEQSRIHDSYINEVWTAELTSSALEKMKGQTFRGYLSHIRSFVRQGKLLDIGCATGDLMKVAQQYGYDVYGVEVAARGAEVCAGIFGHERIISRELKKGDFPCGYFSVVTLFDTLEHVASPHDLLGIIHDLLAEDGILVMVTPDASSLSARISGGHWLHYKPEHLFYYSRRNIGKLLEPLFAIRKITCASKTISLGYAGAAIAFNTKSVVRTVIGRLLKGLPKGVKKMNARMPFGEMLVIAQKVRKGTI
jgi:SAM-dependent methyltransferase